MYCATTKFVPGYYSPWEEGLFVLLSVAAGDGEAMVMVAGLVVDWVLDDIVWAVGGADDPVGSLRR